MPYQANQDVTIPKVIGTRVGPMGKRLELKEAINYVEGEVVFEADISPDVLTRLENGDDHLSTLLRYVDPAEARAIMNQQIAEHSSLDIGEAEILHSDERLGGGMSPEDVPNAEEPYEEPTGDSQAGSGGHVVTEDQTVGQGTQKVTEEEANGSSESDGSSETEIEEETEAEAAEDAAETDEDAASEDQEDEQDQSTDDQDENEEDEVEGDQYDAMDLVELRAAAKAADIKGRTKMDESKLREELRA